MKSAVQRLAWARWRPATPSIAAGWGVGRPGRPPLPGGGGYQGSCNASKFEGRAFTDPDPRLLELRAMGTSAVWLRVADLLGFDLYEQMWRIFDSDPSCKTDGGYLRIGMKPYTSWLRFQKNRYIESLTAEGLTPRDIQARIELELRERLSERHISRIARKR